MFSTTIGDTLITEACTNDIMQYELVKEKMTIKDSEVVQFTSSLQSNEGVPIAIKKRIRDVNVFKWRTRNDYKYSVEGELNKEIMTRFIKQRSFLNRSKLTIMDEKYKALKFGEMYTAMLLGTEKEYEYVQYNYYIKSIGLPKMEKEFPNGSSEVLVLS